MKDNNSNNNDNKNILKTNNEKQNMNSNTNVSAGGSIHSRNTDKSKTTISKNKNKNINNTFTNNKIVYKFSNNKKDKELKKIERPGLQDIGEGKTITFEAVLVRKYKNKDVCYTIMNLHQGKKYLADHTQLILNEEPEEFIKRNTTNSKLIRATGKIISYGNPNNLKYCINLLPLPKKVVFLPDIHYDNTEIYDGPTKEFKNQMDRCYDKIDCARHDDLLYMIENLRYKINNLTEGTFTNDFIYHFIINQYSLNTLNSDMYNNTIQSDEFDDKDLRNLIVLLGGVLYDLLSNTEIKLYDLLTYSAYRLNKIQHICNFDCNKKESLTLNRYFYEFCRKHNIGFGKGWEFVRCRNKIFPIDINLYDIINEIEDGLRGICYSIM